ncbi:MAG: cation acetate symporter, partial [bacterium]|nr:cation acetate symporter [bacterium]
MTYSVSFLAILLFVLFVVFVIGLSLYIGRKTRSAEGFFAAGGKIHWGVNGIAFAGDYLSAASFLGICGMIAFQGYDGFLYSIGYLAGWVVALFVVAEPLKRMGRFTFTDALDAKFNNKGIQLMAAISTLIVSICYLIPQMVGAGALVTPLLGLPHWIGVVIVGGIVIFIVATAGMASTTYVQFAKGCLLIIFSTILTIYLVNNGLAKKPSEDYHDFQTLNATLSGESVTAVDNPEYTIAGETKKNNLHFVKLEKAGVYTWWKLGKNEKNGAAVLKEALSKTVSSAGAVLYNGEPKEAGKFYQVGHIGKLIKDGKEVDKVKGLNPFSYISTIEDSEIIRFARVPFKDGSNEVTVWYPNPTPGKEIMRPGLKFKVDKGS